VEPRLYNCPHSPEKHGGVDEVNLPHGLGVVVCTDLSPSPMSAAQLNSISAAQVQSALATHIKNTLEESSLGATCKAERCALEIDNERVLVSLYTSLLERTACKSDHQKKVLVWHRGNGWTKEDDIELHISATEVWGWS